MKKTIALPLLLAAHAVSADPSQIFNPWDYNQYFTAMRTATDVGGNTWKLELDDTKFEFAKFNRDQTQCDANVKDSTVEWTVLDQKINLTKSCRLVERFGKAVRTIYILNDKQGYDFLIEAFKNSDGSLVVKKDDDSEIHYTTKDFNNRHYKYINRQIVTYDAWALDAASNAITSRTDIKNGENRVSYDISFDGSQFSIKKNQFTNDEAVPACKEHAQMSERVRFRSGDTIELKTTCASEGNTFKATTIIDDPTAVSALVAQLNTKKGFLLRIKKLEMSISAKDFIDAHNQLSK